MTRDDSSVVTGGHIHSLTHALIDALIGWSIQSLGHLLVFDAGIIAISGRYTSAVLHIQTAVQL